RAPPRDPGQPLRAELARPSEVALDGDEDVTPRVEAPGPTQLHDGHGTRHRRRLSKQERRYAAREERRQVHVVEHRGQGGRARESFEGELRAIREDVDAAERVRSSPGRDGAEAF